MGAKDWSNKELVEKLGYEFLKKDLRQRVLKEKVEAMGKEYRPPDEKKKEGTRMAVRRGPR